MPEFTHATFPADEAKLRQYLQRIFELTAQNCPESAGDVLYTMLEDVALLGGNRPERWIARMLNATDYVPAELLPEGPK